jgi:hypothetical protein
MDSLRGFSFGYTLRSLLNFDMLLVREDTLVMLDRESVSVSAGFTEHWFLNAASLDVLGLFTTTFEAQESSFFHLRDDV